MKIFILPLNDKSQRKFDFYFERGEGFYINWSPYGSGIICKKSEGSPLGKSYNVSPELQSNYSDVHMPFLEAEGNGIDKAQEMARILRTINNPYDWKYKEERNSTVNPSSPKIISLTFRNAFNGIRESGMEPEEILLDVEMVSQYHNAMCFDVSAFSSDDTFETFHFLDREAQRICLESLSNGETSICMMIEV